MKQNPIETVCAGLLSVHKKNSALGIHVGVHNKTKELSVMFTDCKGEYITHINESQIEEVWDIIEATHWNELIGPITACQEMLEVWRSNETNK